MHMNEWYRTSFRRTLLDMHIEDWSEEFLRDYDPEVYFRLLKKAKIQSPMIYVQSHVGLCYWPTKTGVMHRSFAGREDTVKRLFDLCNADGMDTILYYSLIFNNREYDRHPDWRMRDADGYASREHGARYGLCCPNNEDYLEFVCRQIEEFSGYFDFKGVFFDMPFWPEVCYCDACRKRWREEAGGELPRIVDWKDERWLTFARKRQDWMGEFAMKCTQKAKECKPGVSVEHQYSGSVQFWRWGQNENISKASDYIGTDLYGGLREQAFACKVWYNLTQNQPFQYMTGRCYPNLNEHTTTKTPDQLKQCVGLTYIHHGASFMIDAVDPAGTIDPRTYDLIGQIYSETIPCEESFTHGTMKCDVGVYLNLNGKMDVGAEPMDVLDHGLDKENPRGGTMPHVRAAMGASDALSALHIPYGVVNNWKYKDMEKQHVLVLPDVVFMSEEEQEAVLAYIRAGGNVYMSGHSAPAVFEKVFGVPMKGLTEETYAYLAPTEANDFMKPFYSEREPLAMHERAMLLCGEPEGEVLATLTLPYTIPNPFSSVCPTDEAEEDYLTESDPAYRFASIHSNPPGIRTAMPGMLRNGYGEGTVIWSALPIERAARYQHREIFGAIIRYLAGERLSCRIDAAETLECVMFDAPEHREILIGLAETRDGHVIPDTRDTKIWLKCGEPVKRVVDLASGEEIPFTYENGQVHIRIDRVAIWNMTGIYY